MQKARRHVITTLRPLVGRRVPVYFTPLLGVFFHLSPHGTGSAIGLSGVFSLTGWAPNSRKISCLCATQDATGLQSSVVRGFTLYDRLFQGVPLDSILPRRGPANPVSPRDDMGLGSSVFARHYLRNHCLFSPPMGT